MLLARVESFPINLFSLMIERHVFMYAGNLKFVTEIVLINWEMYYIKRNLPLIVKFTLKCLKSRSFSVYYAFRYEYL